MSILDVTYPQESLTSQMQALGIPLDGTIIMPWGGGDQLAIMDETRNIIGYANENEMGGMTFTDESMGVIGSSTPNAMGGETIINDSFQVQGMTSENVHGGENLFGSDMSLETITFSNGLGGENVFSSDMELLGVSNEHLGQINYTGFQDNSSLGVDVPAFDSLSSFASTNATASYDFVTDFASVDFDAGFAEDALGIFDFL